MRNIRGIILLSLMISAFALPQGGCLFEPREAQDPGAGGEDTWVEPEVPRDIFKNLSSGLSEPGNSNYERTISDGFIFIPRTEDEMQYPDLSGWDKEREMNMLDRLKSDYAARREIFFGSGTENGGSFDEENAEGDQPWFEGEYLITLDSGSGEVIYGGVARFTLEAAGQGGWKLVEWEDKDILQDYGTSGLLRGRLSGAD
ncbi:MAG: hypothetical protein U5O15_07260 [Candidatus Krumholzibacteriota bacterium]|nr:hypothetical protein [Candidatus Krumholzibacteriota bacterium]